MTRARHVHELVHELKARNGMVTTVADSTTEKKGQRPWPATEPKGPTGRLATWVAETSLDDVPESVRDRAKHLVLDGVACGLVGAQLPWSRKGSRPSRLSTPRGLAS